VGADAEEKTKMDTESTDIGTGLARHPKDTEVAVIVKLDKLALVDGADTELTLDGGNKRRALEQRTGEGLEGLGESSLAAGHLVMETDNANVLLSGTLLGLDETGSTINTDNQAASDLGIEGTGVASLLNTEHALEPGDNLVGRGVGGLVKVDNTAGNVGLDIAAVGGRTGRNGCPVVGANEQLIVVLQEERQVLVIYGSSRRRRGHDDILGDRHV
jgi:hypothetical protein